MKKSKGSLLQRIMAALLSAVLVAGMVSNAAPVTVLAAGNASGLDWELADGRLTIASNAGMDDWCENGIGYYNYDVTSAEIQSGVTSIGEKAFFGCCLMTSITIPASVTSIGDKALANCIRLETVTMLGETPPALGSNVFGDMRDADNDSRCKFIKDNSQGIHVPEGTAETYKKAEGWSAYADNITDQKAVSEAKIGDTEYATLEEAVAAATGGTEDDPVCIEILSDITLDKAIILSDKYIKLVSEGDYVIRRGTKESWFYIYDSAALTLGDAAGMKGTITIDGGAIWTGEEDPVLGRGTVNTGIKSECILFEVEGTLNLYSNVIIQNTDCDFNTLVSSRDSAGAIHVLYTGNLNILGRDTK